MSITTLSAHPAIHDTTLLTGNKGSRPTLDVLMITEVLDRESFHLGFATRWVSRLAAHVNQLTALALFHTQFNHPPNVQVHAAQKHCVYAALGTGTLVRIYQLLALCLSIARHLLFGKIDVVLAHMNPIFVILAYPWARLRGIPIVLWYTRGNIFKRLRLAHLLCDCVVTASAESFNMTSEKKTILGHGIDTEMFSPNAAVAAGSEKKIVLFVGRIAPIKRCDLILEAFALLKTRPWFKDCCLLFVGDVVFSVDRCYLASLRERAKNLGIESQVEFKGGIPYDGVPDAYRSCAIFVNATDPGSVDKAVLEAMACGKPVVTSNTACEKLLGEYQNRMFVPGGDPVLFAEKMGYLLEMGEAARDAAGRTLRELVLKNHSLDGLCMKLTVLMEKLVTTK